MESVNGSAERVSHQKLSSRSKSFVGQMGQKVVIPLAGTKMFLIAKSLMEKSFEITVGHLVLAVSILALIAGGMVGIKFDRSRSDIVNFDGHKWILIGMSYNQQYGIYVPVYKTVEQAMRDRSLH